MKRKTNPSNTTIWSKTTATILLLACAWCFTACKDDKKDDLGDTTTTAKLASHVHTSSKAIGTYSDKLSATQDATQAAEAAKQWLMAQDDVQLVEVISEELIRVTYKNGLSSAILFVEANADGTHKTRGAGAGALAWFGDEDPPEKKAIRNNKVLVINQFTQEFYPDGYNKRSQFEGGSVAMDVTILNDQQVTYDVLGTLGNYGLIIINTHGSTDGFHLARLLDVAPADGEKNVTEEDIKKALAKQGNFPVEKFENGELGLDILAEVNQHEVRKQSVLVSVRAKYIINSVLDMKDAVVFGNYCYSGHNIPNDPGMPSAWRSKGLSSYYGYTSTDGVGSRPVGNDFAKAMEDSLIVNLIHDLDTTGVAHFKNNVELQRDINYQRAWFHHFFETNYAYLCGDTIIDPRDGQKHPTVCIGKQVWMAKNLNWKGKGRYYNDDPKRAEDYGRLYTWEEATGGVTSVNGAEVQGGCPIGWHIPSRAEWEELITFVGGKEVAGGKLKSKRLWVKPENIAEEKENNTDDYGFSMVPAGTFSHFYSDEGKYGTVWSSSKAALYGVEYPVFFGFSSLKRNVVPTSQTDGVQYAYSVRCVKNK